MLTNDILRRVRYATDLSDPLTLELIQRGGKSTNREQLQRYLKREDEDGFERCPDVILAAFLNGLVIHRRGARDDTPQPETKMDNNLVLKKIRIAFKLEEAELLGLFTDSPVELSRSELSAFFRKPGHKHYRACGDQVLRQVLRGITSKFRPDAADENSPEVPSGVWPEDRG